MYHSFLIHSSADGHLGCFHVLAIINSVKVFSNELVLHIRWPKYWSISFSFSVSPSNEYSGLISFLIDRLDLLAVQYPIKQEGATNWNVATPEMPPNRINKGELIYQPITLKKGFPGGSDDKDPTCNVGDLSSIPGLGRSPGGGHGNALQYSCLENPMDRGAWWATVHGVPKRHRTRLFVEMI